MASLQLKRDTETAKKVLKSWQFLYWKTKTRLLLNHISRHFGEKYTSFCDKDSLILSSSTSDAKILRDIVFDPLRDNVIKGLIKNRNPILNKFFNKSLSDESSFNDYMMAMGILVEVRET